MLEIGQRVANENHITQTYMGPLCLGDEIFGAKSAESTLAVDLSNTKNCCDALGFTTRMLGDSRTRSAAIRKKIGAYGVHLPRGSKHASILFVLVLGEKKIFEKKILMSLRQYSWDFPDFSFTLIFFFLRLLFSM